MVGKMVKWVSVGIVITLISAGLFSITSDLPAGDVEAKYVNSASKFMNINGMRVHYRDQGSGPALMLIHGSNSSLHTWEGWVRELSDDFRVISLDLPGHGLTGPDAKERYDWISMVKVVDQLAQKLGVKTFSIAGNSMGGAIAWNYTVLHPEKIEKLILLDSAGYPHEEGRPAILTAFGLPIIGHAMTKISSRFAIRKSVEDVYGDKTKVTPKLVTLYQELGLREGNREAARKRLSAKPDGTLYNKIPSITAPTLVLWGDQDRWILPKYAAKFVSDIHYSQLIMYKGLGHVPMEEDPIQTAADAKIFLQK